MTLCLKHRDRLFTLAVSVFLLIFIYFTVDLFDKQAAGSSRDAPPELLFNPGMLCVCRLACYWDQSFQSHIHLHSFCLIFR